MTDNNDDIDRRALFETGGEHPEGRDPRGIFAPGTDSTTEKDVDADEDDQEDGRELLKKALGTDTDGDGGETVPAVQHDDDWETGPDALIERQADTDRSSKSVEKEQQEGELNTLGIFETKGDVLRDIREELRTRRGSGGVMKSQDSIPADVSGDYLHPLNSHGKVVYGSDVFERLSEFSAQMDRGEDLPLSESESFEKTDVSESEAVGLATLEATEQVTEDVQELLDAEDTSDEHWQEVEERINELEEQMADAPEPTTEREEAVWAAVQEQAAKILRLLNPNGDGDISDE